MVHVPPSNGALRRLRGFTLIELIVVILILGILAAIAVVGYTQITDRAQASAAQATLRNVATAVLVERTVNQGDELTRAGFLTALEDASADVTGMLPGDNAASPWSVYGRSHAPAAAGEFAIGFDYLTDADASDDNDVRGTRAVLLTYGGGRVWARVIVFGAADPAGLNGLTGTVPAGTLVDEVLANPGLITPARPPQAGGPGGGGAPGGGEVTVGMFVALRATDERIDDPSSFMMTPDGEIPQPREVAMAQVTAAPAGTASMTMACTTDSPLPTPADGFAMNMGGAWMLTWYSPSQTTEDTARTYTCTITALNAGGSVLGTQTRSAQVMPMP